jgi:hypothetical protein
MLTPVDFGPVKPSIATFYGGYRVPVALQQVDIPAGADGSAAQGWRGYLLELAGLTEVEFDRAAGELPPGDYSADKLAALTEAVRLQRKAAYPPVEEYVDGVVKDDAAQIAEYKAKCLAVKADHPLPWDAKAAYKVGDLVSHADKRWKATSNNTGNTPDDVVGDWEAI